VLLWEVMSLGYMPYPGRGNQEVMQLVTGGGRLEAPPGCPGPAYRIMVHCWHTNPEERPSFVTVLERIGYCIQDPDVLAMPIPVFQRPISTERETATARPLTGVDECLRVLRPHGSMSNVAGSAPSYASDYLVPLNAAEETNRQERCGYWETSFTREGVKAIARGEPPPASLPSESTTSQPANELVCSGSTGNLNLGEFHSRYSASETSGALGLSASQSTQPLLDDSTQPDSPPKDDVDDEDSGSASLALDASLLCRQSYANVRIVTPTPSTPSVRSTPPKGERSVKKNEISC